MFVLFDLLRKTERLIAVFCEKGDHSVFLEGAL